jgi:hypothetical protein
VIRFLTLLLQDMSKDNIQENFKRVENFANDATMQKMQFSFYEIVVPGAVTNHSFMHNLNFTPKDVLLLNVSPYTTTITWRYNKFDENFIYFDTSAGATIRFLLGRYAA